MIRLRCGKCKLVLNVPDEKAGAVVACACGQKLRVPAGKGGKPVVAGAKAPSTQSKMPAGKTGAGKPGKGKPSAKAPGKPTEPDNKPWQTDDDFNPYTLQPMSEPPPPIEIPRGHGDDEDEDDRRGKKKSKKRKKKEGGGVSQTRIVLGALVLVVLVVVLMIVLIQRQKDDDKAKKDAQNRADPPSSVAAVPFPYPPAVTW